MYDIQLNESGTRRLNISADNLATIRKYNLFHGLVDSTGYVTEQVLDRLKLNIRALIAGSTDDRKALLDLCIDVVYHNHMKAYGLRELIALYNAWLAEKPEKPEAEGCVEGQPWFQR